MTGWLACVCRIRHIKFEAVVLGCWRVVLLAWLSDRDRAEKTWAGRQLPAPVLLWILCRTQVWAFHLVVLFEASETLLSSKHIGTCSISAQASCMSKEKPQSLQCIQLAPRIHCVSAWHLSRRCSYDAVSLAFVLMLTHLPPALPYHTTNTSPAQHKSRKSFRKEPSPQPNIFPRAYSLSFAALSPFHHAARKVLLRLTLD